MAQTMFHRLSKIKGEVYFYILFTNSKLQMTDDSIQCTYLIAFVTSITNCSMSTSMSTDRVGGRFLFLQNLLGSGKIHATY